MEYTIKNSELKVRILQKGAELASIQDEKSGLEMMWEALSEHWGRHSCILFPIVGRLKDDRFEWKGKHYSMKQHGFAREMPFELVEQSAKMLSFELRAEPATKAQYPFDFSLKAIYQLADRTLTVTYKVENTGGETMYFSVGAHPAFRCPLFPNEKRSDYKLVFEQAETASTHLLENGLFSGAKRPVLQNAAEIDIQDDLFDQDALVFKQLKSQQVHLENALGQRVLSVGYEGNPYLGIWSKSREAPFVCIEPWQGLADAASSSGKFEDKEGMVSLAPHHKYSVSHQITVGKFDSNNVFFI